MQIYSSIIWIIMIIYIEMWRKINNLWNDDKIHLRKFKNRWRNY